MNYLAIYDKEISLLKKSVSEKRFNHSIRVLEKAIELAVFFHIPQTDNLYYACILHDVTKEKDNIWQKEALKKCEFDDELINNIPEIWHAYTACVYLRENNFLIDQEVQKAIEDHTEGNENSSEISMILFCADLTEDGRVFSGLEKLREYQKYSLEEYYYFLIDNQKKYLEKNNLFVTTKTIKALKFYENPGNYSK